MGSGRRALGRAVGLSWSSTQRHGDVSALPPARYLGPGAMDHECHHPASVLLTLDSGPVDECALKPPMETYQGAGLVTGQTAAPEQGANGVVRLLDLLGGQEIPRVQVQCSLLNGPGKGFDQLLDGLDVDSGRSHPRGPGTPGPSASAAQRDGPQLPARKHRPEPGELLLGVIHHNGKAISDSPDTPDSQTTTDSPRRSDSV